jgi:hypothetical protein
MRRYPPMVLVSVTAGSFAEGDGLSSTLERALPKVVEVVAGNQRGGPGRPQVVAGVRPAISRIRSATSLIPRPIRMNSTPMAMAMAATP